MTIPDAGYASASARLAPCATPRTPWRNRTPSRDWHPCCAPRNPRLPCGFALRDAVALLHLAGQFVAIAGNRDDGIIGELAPLRLYLSPELLTVAFYNIPVHIRPLPFLNPTGEMAHRASIVIAWLPLLMQARQMAAATSTQINAKTGLIFRSSRCDGIHRATLVDGLGGSQRALAADVVRGKVRLQDHTASDVRFSVAGQHGGFELKPLTMRIYSGQGSGRIQADFTGAVPHYRVRYSLSQFHINEFLMPLSPQHVAEGSMDFSANLSMPGNNMNQLRRTAAAADRAARQESHPQGPRSRSGVRPLRVQPNHQLRGRGRLLFCRASRPGGHQGVRRRKHLSGVEGPQRDPDARLGLESRARRGAGAGLGHGDEREPGRPPWRARFRQQAVR